VRKLACAFQAFEKGLQAFLEKKLAMLKQASALQI